MRRNCVYTPDGVKVTVNLDDPNLMQFLQEHRLDPYLPLIESGWLDASKKNGFTTLEDRIKKYLERLTTLLLQDPWQVRDPDGIHAAQDCSPGNGADRLHGGYTDSIDPIEPHHVMCVDSSPCRYGAQIEAGGIEHNPHDEQEDV